MAIQSEFVVKVETKDFFELQIKGGNLFNRLLLVFFSYFFIYVLFIILPFENYYLFIGILTVLFSYQIQYVLKNVYVLLKVNKTKNKIYSYNLFGYILKKPITINSSEIRDLIIKESPNPYGRTSYTLQEILEPFERSYDKIIIQKINGENTTIYSSVSSENVNFISWKISEYIGCNVYVEKHWTND